MKIILLLSTLSLSLMAGITDISSLYSRFEQFITNEQSKVIIYKGEVFAQKKGSKALWKYVTPIQKRIYFTDNKVIMIEPELEQAIITKLHKAPDILKILKNARKIQKGLYEAKCCENTYKISFEGRLIRNIDYTDKIGNHVVITFLKPTQNKKLNPKIFNYHIPKDYDIITNQY